MAIQLDDLVARLRLDTSGVGTGLSGLNSSLSSVGTQASNAGKKLSLGVTAPLVGIGIAATNLAAGFDKTMRQVSIATGGPTDALSKLAIQMGAETAFSANEAADAMLELAKGGMTAAQVQGGALAATMKLASAGGVGLAEASTYVSNSMAAFGLAAKDADSVTVALAGAANASSASVESLGMGLSQAAASAVNAGLSLQETTGVLSLFDSVGLKGSDAGTSLKSMLNSLIPTTEAAAGAMADANLNFVDAEGNFVGVANMAEQLKKGLGGMTQAQRASTLETIFGSDGMRAASALMRGGADAVNKYTAASRDQKTTTELANAAMEGTSGAMERASGSIETAALMIGQVLAPYVEKAAGVIETLANRFSTLPAGVQGTIVAGGALLAVLGPLLIAFGVIASSLGTVVGLFTAAAPAAGAAGAAAGASVAPFLLVAGAIAGVAAGFYLLYTRSETFRSVVQAGVAQVQSAFAGLLATVQPIVAQIVGVFVAQLPQIQQTVSSVFGSVKAIVAAAMSIVASIIKGATLAIRVVWSVFGNTILSTISGALSAVQTVIRGAFRVVEGIFQTVAAVLRGDWSGAWDGIKKTTSGALAVLQGLVAGGFAVIRGIFGGIGAALSALWDGAWSLVKGATMRGIEAVVSLVKGIKGKVTGALSGAGEWLKEIGSNIVQGLVNGIQAAAGRVAAAVSAITNAIPGKIKSLMGIASPSKVTTELGGYIGDGLAIGIQQKTAAVGKAVDKVVAAAVDAGEKRKDRLKAVGDLLGDGFADGIAGRADDVAAEMSKLMDAVEATHNRRALQIVATAKAALIPLTQQYTELRVQLAEATKDLTAFEDARQVVEARQAALASAGGDLGSLTFGSDDEGTALPPTAQRIIDALTQVQTVAADFDMNLARLRDAGLSQDALDQLIAKGPEAAAATAQAILDGGGPAIAQINALQEKIAGAGLSIQSKASQTMYDAGVAAQQGLISGLESQMQGLEEQMNRIAKAMVRAIRKALQIKSPSKIMAGLGEYTGEGFAAGISSTVDTVRRASIGMADAAQAGVPAYADPTVASLAARRAASAAAGAGAVTPTVRVFIGDRELTDIVRVEMGDAMAPLTTAVRQGIPA